MNKAVFTQSSPGSVPGATLERADMARITGDDWSEIRKLARGYCHAVDATRSRKRADGSATVVKHGHAPYGTDDVCDDTAQDAVLIFAQKLREVTAHCVPTSGTGAAPENLSWLYVRRDGAQMTVTRAMLRRWAVRDAAARNGYRQRGGSQPQRTAPDTDGTALAMLRGSALAQHSGELFAMAWGDGGDFPTLAKLMEKADAADDLGRAGTFAALAQERHGGAYGSRRQVIRTREEALAEWRELSARLDDARDTFGYGDNGRTP
ncbi:hypothetical protein [Actinomadura rupiterrae]|uniref:hypothetical protein n=1 Tax=Actinomadura rupiterrae TaxID=559627 RepID=UPI0020A39D06|nr:hypothetical protein [Actinomadura rupiterrae]MCP2337506.1 galactarate dehydratase [Actinomadura rupiterrae]